MAGHGLINLSNDRFHLRQNRGPPVVISLKGGSSFISGKGLLLNRAGDIDVIDYGRRIIDDGILHGHTEADLNGLSLLQVSCKRKIQITSPDNHPA